MCAGDGDGVCDGAGVAGGGDGVCDGAGGASGELS